MAAAAGTGLQQTMSGRKADKQPGNRQEKNVRQQKRESCKEKSKTSIQQ